ncbi:MAG: benzoate/H(+) symporter BenE family transporter [Geminicoccales bacterium]
MAAASPSFWSAGRPGRISPGRALAGLAILSALQDALEKAFSSTLRFGALVAFLVAVTPFAVLGISSAFWAVLAGLAGSALLERQQLAKELRS